LKDEKITLNEANEKISEFVQNSQFEKKVKEIIYYEGLESQKINKIMPLEKLPLKDATILISEILN